MLKYFRISELLVSPTGDRLGLNNDPPRWVVANLEALIERVLDPLRERFGAPIIVNSGYRSIPVNNAVGGVRNSQHLKGQAADIRGTTREETARLWRLVQEFAQDCAHVDQAINEKPDGEGRPTWVHISWSSKPRHQVLTLR